MAFDIIDSSYSNLDVSQLLPSFFQWMFGNALNFNNGSLWGIGLLMVVAVVSLFTFKSFSTDRAMIVSAFITWIISLLALKAGWISNFIFTLTCIYVVYALYELFKKRSAEEM
jgi:hypothetical protein